MAIYNDATPRQQEILQQLSSKIGGFAVGDITNITYDEGIPVVIDFTNESGSATRETVSALGGIINDIEHAKLQDARAQRQSVDQALEYALGSGGNNEIDPTQVLQKVLTPDNNETTTTQYNSNSTPSFTRILNSGLSNIFFENSSHNFFILDLSKTCFFEGGANSVGVG